jgi:DNA-directed RNA polymerase specialized sigma24 family protein
MPAKSRPWRLTGHALDRLLEALADDPEASARAYGLLRQRLAAYFDRRSIPDGEVLADEALDRVARRLEQGVQIASLAGYAYGVARLLSLEWHRRQGREAFARRLHPPGPDQPDDSGEARIACLDRCLEELPEESRELILSYYRCRVRERKVLADRLDLSYANLKAKAHRIRGRLERCLEECLGTRGRNR